MGDGQSSRFRFDAVILSWNRKKDTLETIANVNAQTGVDVTVWVVDQGSEPGCIAALRKRKEAHDIKLVELGRNLGVAGGRNVGMRQGSAPYVVCIDNDAVFADPRSLARVAGRFAADEKLGAIGFRILNYFTGEQDWGSWVYPRTLKQRRSEEFVTTRYCGAGHALRRSAIEETNLYDDQLFFYWEEVDLSYQLIELGYRIIYDPGIEVLHKVSPEARADWSGSRFYYLVRNALYLDYMYYRSPWRVLVRGGAYLLKGVRNGVAAQVPRAWRDCARMVARENSGRKPLGPDARRYVREHELRYRGSVWRRLRDEVLERLS